MEWKENGENEGSEAGKHEACIGDRKDPVGLEWSILCQTEEGAGQKSQPIESLEGQVHGLGQYPAGCGEPLKVIEQGSDICSNWMAEFVPGWEDIGRESTWRDSKGERPWLQGQLKLGRNVPCSLGWVYVTL